MLVLGARVGWTALVPPSCAPPCRHVAIPRLRWLLTCPAAPALRAVPAVQPAVRDFNEEDYMDGDLMDEELVE